MTKLTPLRELTSNIVGEIWDDLSVHIDSPTHTKYASVVFSIAKEEKDEEK